MDVKELIDNAIIFENLFEDYKSYISSDSKNLRDTISNVASNSKTMTLQEFIDNKTNAKMVVEILEKLSKHTRNIKNIDTKTVDDNPRAFLADSIKHIFFEKGVLSEIMTASNEIRKIERNTTNYIYNENLRRKDKLNALDKLEKMIAEKLEALKEDEINKKNEWKSIIDEENEKKRKEREMIEMNKKIKERKIIEKAKKDLSKIYTKSKKKKNERKFDKGKQSSRSVKKKLSKRREILGKINTNQTKSDSIGTPIHYSFLRDSFIERLQFDNSKSDVSDALFIPRSISAQQLQPSRLDINNDVWIEVESRVKEYYKKPEKLCKNTINLEEKHKNNIDQCASKYFKKDKILTLTFSDMYKIDIQQLFLNLYACLKHTLTGENLRFLESAYSRTIYLPLFQTYGNPDEWELNKEYYLNLFSKKDGTYILIAYHIGSYLNMPQIELGLCEHFTGISSLFYLSEMFNALKETREILVTMIEKYDKKEKLDDPDQKIREIAQNRKKNIDENISYVEKEISSVRLWIKYHWKEFIAKPLGISYASRVKSKYKNTKTMPTEVKLKLVSIMDFPLVESENYYLINEQKIEEISGNLKYLFPERVSKIEHNLLTDESKINANQIITSQRIYFENINLVAKFKIGSGDRIIWNSKKVLCSSIIKDKQYTRDNFRNFLSSGAIAYTMKKENYYSIISNIRDIKNVPKLFLHNDFSLGNNFSAISNDLFLSIVCESYSIDFKKHHSHVDWMPSFTFDYNAIFNKESDLVKSKIDACQLAREIYSGGLKSNENESNGKVIEKMIVEIINFFSKKLSNPFTIHGLSKIILDFFVGNGKNKKTTEKLEKVITQSEFYKSMEDHHPIKAFIKFKPNSIKFIKTTSEFSAHQFKSKDHELLGKFCINIIQAFLLDRSQNYSNARLIASLQYIQNFIFFSSSSEEMRNSFNLNQYWSHTLKNKYTFDSRISVIDKLKSIDHLSIDSVVDLNNKRVFDLPANVIEKQKHKIMGAISKLGSTCNLKSKNEYAIKSKDLVIFKSNIFESSENLRNFVNFSIIGSHDKKNSKDKIVKSIHRVSVFLFCILFSRYRPEEKAGGGFGLFEDMMDTLSPENINRDSFSSSSSSSQMISKHDVDNISDYSDKVYKELMKHVNKSQEHRTVNIVGLIDRLIIFMDKKQNNLNTKKSRIEDNVDLAFQLYNISINVGNDVRDNLWEENKALIFSLAVISSKYDTKDPDLFLQLTKTIKNHLDKLVRYHIEYTSKNEKTFRKKMFFENKNDQIHKLSGEINKILGNMNMFDTKKIKKNISKKNVIKALDQFKSNFLPFVFLLDQRWEGDMESNQTTISTIVMNYANKKMFDDGGKTETYHLDIDQLNKDKINNVSDIYTKINLDFEGIDVVVSFLKRVIEQHNKSAFLSTSNSKNESDVSHVLITRSDVVNMNRKYLSRYIKKNEKILYQNRGGEQINKLSYNDEYYESVENMIEFLHIMSSKVFDSIKSVSENANIEIFSQILSSVFSTKSDEDKINYCDIFKICADYIVRLVVCSVQISLNIFYHLSRFILEEKYIGVSKIKSREFLPEMEKLKTVIESSTVSDNPIQMLSEFLNNRNIFVEMVYDFYEGVIPNYKSFYVPTNKYLLGKYKNIEETKRDIIDAHSIDFYDDDGDLKSNSILLKEHLSMPLRIRELIYNRQDPLPGRMYIYNSE